MTNYKGYRIIDSKSMCVVISENGEIINRNPTKDELKRLGKYLRKPYPRGNKKVYRYNNTDTCDRCREEGIETKLVPFKTVKEYGADGNWDGKFVCRRCYNKDYQKNNPNSQNNIIKSLRDRRIGTLDQISNQAKGDNFEELTCIWRSSVSTTKVENLNKKYNNFEASIDHSKDSELGIIQTRGRSYDPYERRWDYSNFGRDWYKEFDVYILYCASEDNNIIERVYIIPKEEMANRTSISIYKNPSRIGWYKKYRILDENVLKLIDNIWKKITDKR